MTAAFSLPPDFPDHATTMETAKAIRVSYRTLFRYIEDGTAPRHYRLPNGHVRFRREDVEAWLADRARADAAITRRTAAVGEAVRNWRPPRVRCIYRNGVMKGVEVEEEH